MANDMRMPCTLMAGAPTENTVGWVGMLIMDTTSADGDIYKCVRVSGGIYIWRIVGSGGGGGGISPVMFGATETENGTAGLVPAPMAGEQDFVLFGDGTWRVLPEGGSVDVDAIVDAVIAKLPSAEGVKFGA